ncbi:MAG TPA: hypothetical protein PLZ58_03830 [Candidatus Saccharibacteria bacterium]|nr:hypothetical protein [Candidatus Saccharibacteria bacterium]HRQ06797.1 hypothetical protein [Candidatus Saccharibacteria bacterium]
MNDNNNYTDVLLEDINSKMDAVFEVVQDTRDQIKTLARQSDLESLQSNVQLIRTALTDTTAQINKQDQRITKLELKHSSN